MNILENLNRIYSWKVTDLWDEWGTSCKFVSNHSISLRGWNVSVGQNGAQVSLHEAIEWIIDEFIRFILVNDDDSALFLRENAATWFYIKIVVNFLSNSLKKSLWFVSSNLVGNSYTKWHQNLRHFPIMAYDLKGRNSLNGYKFQFLLSSIRPKKSKFRKKVR
jgi:hypothetical protein